MALDLDALVVEEGAGDVGDVVAAVAILRPAGVVGADAARARLHRLRQVLDLHAGVVVVELALHVPAVGIEHARDAVADHRRAAVADVQRAGGVGRDVFDAGHAARAAGVAAEGFALRVHFAQLALPGFGREAEIEEAGASDLDRCDVAAGGDGFGQRLRDGARVAARGLGQQHCGVAGEVAVRALLGPLDHEVGRGQVGRQEALRAEGGDALFDQGLER